MTKKLICQIGINWNLCLLRGKFTKKRKKKLLKKK